MAVTAIVAAAIRRTPARAVRPRPALVAAKASSTARDPNSENEPNNNLQTANVIALNTPIYAEIASDSDTDFFAFTTPQPPRDILEIEIENGSRTLIPAMKIFGAERQFLGWGADRHEPGASLSQVLAPPPKTTFYLQIWGHNRTTGRYVLTVRSQHAFDEFEPNDDILNATPLAAGKTLKAGIMDSKDTDFYRFTSPRTGSLSVSVENRSRTLIPALSVFASDRRFLEFGPDIRSPGASLRHTFTAEADKTYYIQVWSQGNSSGDYSVTVQ